MRYAFPRLIKVSNRHVFSRQITMRETTTTHKQHLLAPLPPSPTSTNTITAITYQHKRYWTATAATSITLSNHHHHHHHHRHLGHRDRNKLRNTRHTLLAHREQIIPAWDQDAGVVGQRHRVRVVGGGGAVVRGGGEGGG